MIEIKDIITLNDNNEYGVVSKITKDNTIYYYLVDINNNSNIKFCYEDKTNDILELVEINDEKLIRNLILSFTENIKDVF